MTDQSNRGKSPHEVVENAIAQLDGLRKGKPVKRPGWYYLDALDAEERAVIIDGKRVIRRSEDDREDAE
ncbi:MULTISPECIES: hypothetical protein [unclassified Serratia (in: enterobacteria)]|uniref:hypothetical protein n=1 Tax=unclassified Serratia (in: enterobacteria) TaxID=2647522 RepID=UPI00050373A3|nr:MULTISPECIES: hypothetical protein [unclassified Serratia (in: enterobacteria)]KFK93585.1 hypothetical protein JV45_15715 [Serratia sp. Ag2]KFK93850.1 hypothetical protein IV04_23420 [Serratia sp. Ag1]